MVGSSAQSRADASRVEECPQGTASAAGLSQIQAIIKAEYGARGGATQDFNALRSLLDMPSKHLWVTFEEGCMWWCTVRDGIKVNPKGQDLQNGNFWLTCDRPWSNRSLGGKLLAISDLPGTVTTTAGFKATACTPKDWRTMIRIIQDQKIPMRQGLLKLAVITSPRST